ncbi:hypothetical protein [uncultured Sphingomonas sp.]|uniref:hypothetical protein n=1 Tax=uncultured Sphingomonas sp. TaxID=158754 RepID=UPI0025FE02F2|nr:hypothetical protein [uncultured Sphingomonas sp.]
MRKFSILFPSLLVAAMLSTPAVAQGLPTERCAATVTIQCSRNYAGMGYSSPAQCYAMMYDEVCGPDIPKPPEPVPCDSVNDVCQVCPIASRLDC